MRRITHYAIASLCLIAVWEAGSRLLGQALLPAPGAVLLFLGEMIGDSLFWQHCASSVQRLITALALAFGVGFPAGLMLGHSRRADAYLSPFVFLTYPIPKIVLLPVFLTILGLGEAPRIALIALTTGYQILVVTRASALHLDTRYIDSFRSMGGSPLQLLRHVLIPAALPDAMTALRVATGTAVAVLFMVESFASQKGLGFLIMDAWGRGDLLEMFSAIVALSLVGVCLYETCNQLEQWVCAWKSARSV